jgi:hypothetical protein
MGSSASLSITPLVTRQGQTFQGTLTISGSTVSSSVYNIFPLVNSSGSKFGTSNVTPQWTALNPVLGLTPGGTATTCSIPVEIDLFTNISTKINSGVLGVERIAGDSVFTLQYQVIDLRNGSSSFSNTVVLTASM